MKRIYIAFSLFILSITANAQADGWAAYMMPGEVHKQLNQYAVSNDWMVRMSVWSGDGAIPESFDLKANIRSIMDGRFIEIHYVGEVAGLKFDAISYLGFNNATNKFSHINFSSFGTGFTTKEGTWNPAQKVADLKGSTQSPEDKKTILLRETIKFIGLDEIVFESYDTREGQKEFKSVEFILTKRK